MVMFFFFLPLYFETAALPRRELHQYLTLGVCERTRSIESVELKMLWYRGRRLFSSQRIHWWILKLISVIEASANVSPLIHEWNTHKKMHAVCKKGNYFATFNILLEHEAMDIFLHPHQKSTPLFILSQFNIIKNSASCFTIFQNRILH